MKSVSKKVVFGLCLKEGVTDFGEVSISNPEWRERLMRESAIKLLRHPSQTV